MESDFLRGVWAMACTRVQVYAEDERAGGRPTVELWQEELIAGTDESNQVLLGTLLFPVADDGRVEVVWRPDFRVIPP